MSKLTNKQFFFLILGLIILCEIISFTGFFAPLVVNIFTALVVIATIFITLHKSAYGFLILLAELIIGSQGYLLWIGQAGNHISLRIALWLVVMVIWLTKELTELIKTKKLAKHFKGFTAYFPFLLLLVALIIALINGFLNQHDSTLIFIEAKRWLYIIAIIPLVICLKDEKLRQDFTSVISASAIWVALKTLILLYIFSHGLNLATDIYAWTRADLLGEITKLPNGFSRVFLQSQVFIIPAFIFSLAIFFKVLFIRKWQVSKQAVLYGLTSALFLAVILTSLSRSFWFGLTISLIFVAFLIIFFIRPKIKNLFKALLGLISVLLATLIILFITLEFPIPKPLFSFNASVLSDRASEADPASDSRWALLPVMNNEILKQPILGFGFGKTLTYKSSDPRVVKSSIDGTYTTNAFEWGWLDLWLKLGALGIIAYLWLLLAICQSAILKIKTNPYRALASIASILALVGLNVFTPYLNHPLGFAYLGIIMIILGRED